jgi:hypothetical protein
MELFAVGKAFPGPGPGSPIFVAVHPMPSENRLEERSAITDIRGGAAMRTARCADLAVTSVVLNSSESRRFPVP